MAGFVTLVLQQFSVGSDDTAGVSVGAAPAAGRWRDVCGASRQVGSRQVGVEESKLLLSKPETFDCEDNTNATESSATSPWVTKWRSG